METWNENNLNYEFNYEDYDPINIEEFFGEDFEAIITDLQDYYVEQQERHLQEQQGKEHCSFNPIEDEITEQLYKEIEDAFETAKQEYARKNFGNANKIIYFDIIKRYNLYFLKPQREKYKRLLADVFLYGARCCYILFAKTDKNYRVKYALQAYLNYNPEDKKAKEYLEHFGK